MTSLDPFELCTVRFAVFQHLVVILREGLGDVIKQFEIYAYEGQYARIVHLPDTYG